MGRVHRRHQHRVSHVAARLCGSCGAARVPSFATPTHDLLSRSQSACGRTSLSLTWMTRRRGCMTSAAGSWCVGSEPSRPTDRPSARRSSPRTMCLRTSPSPCDEFGGVWWSTRGVWMGKRRIRTQEQSARADDPATESIEEGSPSPRTVSFVRVPRAHAGPDLTDGLAGTRGTAQPGKHVLLQQHHAVPDTIWSLCGGGAGDGAEEACARRAGRPGLELTPGPPRQRSRPRRRRTRLAVVAWDHSRGL